MQVCATLRRSAKAIGFVKAADVWTALRHVAPLAAAIVLLAGQLRAQEAVPIQVSYQAAPGCPSAQSFVARLKMHTRRLRLSSDPDALELDVTVRATATGYAGKLSVLRPEGGRGSREFQDTQCTEVVAALALSAALSIDPDAVLTVPSEENGSDGANEGSVEGQSPTSSVDGSEPRPKEDSATKAAAESTGQQGQPASGREDESAGGAPSMPARRWSIGPALAASFSFEPKMALGFGGMVAVRDTTGRLLFPLELALELDYLSTRATRGDDHLRLDWLEANLSYCAGRLLQGNLLVCGIVQGGAITAEGVGLSNSERVRRGFFAAGFGLRARVPVSEHLEIVGMLDALFPLVERSFAVDPGPVVISRSRPVGGNVSLGALLGF